MIVYIGDIAINDSVVLKSMAECSKNILEFGCGASTQVLRHYTRGKLTSVDTERVWIERTKKNLEFLEITKPVDFKLYDEFKPRNNYDFIFDDGLMTLRGVFAINHWNNLLPGGTLAFHDTRRGKNIVYVSDLLKHFFCEIENISVNHMESNITLVKKRAVPLVYENWNQTENKKRWQYGHGEINVEEYNALKSQTDDN